MKVKPVLTYFQLFGLPVSSVNAILKLLDELCISESKVMNFFIISAACVITHVYISVNSIPLF